MVTPWRLDAQDAGGDVHWVSGPEPPFPDSLCPAWLLISSRLEVRGDARVCGRDAVRVEVTRRARMHVYPTGHGPATRTGAFTGPVAKSHPVATMAEVESLYQAVVADW